MVNVGNLEIVGTINTAQIDAGLTRIRGSLRATSDSTKPVQADLTRMTNSLNKMSTAFIGLAIGGVGFFAGLARSAPAVAGAMAKIQVSMGELGRSLGVALKPQFEFFADKLQDISDFVQAHPDLVGDLTTSVLVLGGALAGVKFFQFATGVNLLVLGFSALAGVLGLPVWLTVLGTLAVIAFTVFNITKSLREFGEFRVEGSIPTGPLGLPSIEKTFIFYFMGKIFDAFSREKDRSSELMSYADQSYG